MTQDHLMLEIICDRINFVCAIRISEIMRKIIRILHNIAERILAINKLKIRK